MKGCCEFLGYFGRLKDVIYKSGFDPHRKPLIAPSELQFPLTNLLIESGLCNPNAIVTAIPMRDNSPSVVGPPSLPQVSEFAVEPLLPPDASPIYGVTSDQDESYSLHTLQSSNIAMSFKNDLAVTRSAKVHKHNSHFVNSHQQ